MAQSSHAQHDADELDELEGDATGTEPEVAPPAGFESRGGDLAGYWEPASQGSSKTPPRSGSPAVLFTPLFVTLSDSKIPPQKGQPPKSSTLLHCRLEHPCRLRSAEKSEGYKVFPAGTLFGIWTKPGMKRLQNLAHTVVWMKNDGFKDVGQMSDMVLFDIQNEKEGTRLKVQEDRRDKSLSEKERAARTTATVDLSDIPF